MLYSPLTIKIPSDILQNLSVVSQGTDVLQHTLFDLTHRLYRSVFCHVQQIWCL